MSQEYEEVDSLIEDRRNADKVYAILKKHKESLGPAADGDVELLARLTRACLQKALLAKQTDEKKGFLAEGREYGQKAVNVNAEHAMALKFFTMVTGKSTDFVGLTEKVKLGKQFNDLLTKACKALPDDTRLLHLSARYKFSTSQMGWIEKKAVNALFSNPPNFTIEEALEDFLRVYEKEPTWLDNLLFTAKSYNVLKNKEKAIEFLKKCVEQQCLDDEEERYQAEARELLRKLS